MDLSRHLRELELELTRPNVRSDPQRLDELLHDELVEVGRSGRTYGKADVLDSLPLATPSSRVWIRDFAVAEIVDGLALVTYRAAYVDDDGELFRHSRRSSLWQRTARGWQVRFHQGTPTAACAKGAGDGTSDSRIA